MGCLDGGRGGGIPLWCLNLLGEMEPGLNGLGLRGAHRLQLKSLGVGAAQSLLSSISSCLDSLKELSTQQDEVLESLDACVAA